MNDELRDLSNMIEMCVAGNNEKTRDLMNSMLALMSEEADLSPLAVCIIKLMVLPQLPLKRVLSTFLIQYSDKISDLNILATNNLRKDFKDPNPHVRKLVIKTVCSIPCLKELSEELLPRALMDVSASVRRAAASVCPKVVDSHHPIIEQLYRMIRDPDSLVVITCMCALEDILREEGGIVINNRIAQYISSHMNAFPEWSFVIACDILKKYEPKSEEEVIEFLNVLDDKFDSKNPTEFISATQLAFNLVQKYCESLEKHIIERVFSQIISLLNNSSCEVLYTILDITEPLILKHELFAKHHKQFLCRFCDAVYIKVKKLGLLPFLFNSENCDNIIEELICYCTDMCHAVSKQAVTSFVTILSLHPELCEQKLQTVAQLMHLNESSLIEEIIKCFSNLNFTFCAESQKKILTAITEEYHKITSTEGKIALLWVISQYGSSMESASYILESIMNQPENISNEQIHFVLLTTAVKLFFARPAQMQLLLGQLLQQSSESMSLLIRKQALFYYNLLHNDIKLAVKVVHT